jgi:trigger factor
VLERKEATADTELGRAALETAVARSRFEIPEVLIERHAEEILKGRTNYITSQGVALDTYLGSIGKTQEQWKEEALAEGLDDIRRTVTLDEYANQHEVDVTESEFAEELESVAERYPESERDNVRKAYESDEMKSRLEGRIRGRKALETLVAAIEVTEEEPEGIAAELEISDESEVKPDAEDPGLINENV